MACLVPPIERQELGLMYWNLVSVAYGHTEEPGDDRREWFRVWAPALSVGEQAERVEKVSAEVVLAVDILDLVSREFRTTRLRGR